MTMCIKTYSDLIKLSTFEERFEYLKLNDGRVGEDTFGHLRYLNQQFYKTTLWKHIKRDLIIRDNGCDLGVEGYEIEGRSVYVHHLNPITKNDIINRTEYLTNPEFLICTTFETHQAIHYGDISLLITSPIVRTRNDTCPWRK